jgi:hypothetical protein
MADMAKYIVAIVVVIILALGAGYYLSHRSSMRVNTQTSTTSVTSMLPATSTYATTTFSIVYPSDYTVNESYVDDQVNPKKPIHGVSFTIPGTIATGTNLSSDTHISVEHLPRAKNCTADIYLAANVKAQSITDNGVAYSFASSTDAAAGNRYEEDVYAILDSTPCTAVRYFIHYGAIENYPSAGQPGSVQEFNHDALTAAFDTIRHSLTLTH